ncbi:hypothetical protein K3169_06785 [Pseudomonas phytophila]|uniref:Uncharacterized protein n=1 Tax=Pseudomonas phytophila TaxID=2867264 RepID=A0ABY6FI32_9PSED|nr:MULTISPECIES: hypothetical protein [Pseudomonas]MCD5989757.1 hypothetical protein [Pseudomonas quasicaspiana]UXZ97590.1 hypothetical protein K3169_06785 [Pseudomonas phytophila]
MNINSAGIVSNLSSWVPGKFKDMGIPTTQVDTLVDGKTNSVEKLALDPGAKASGKAEEVEHYVYEEAPWLKLSFDDPLMEMCKDGMYLLEIVSESSGKLTEINSKFEKFSEYIKDLRPDIVSTNYGFTLDENANIKILDGRQPLDEADKLWLTNEINKFKDFRNTVHDHSKALMAIVDHSQDFGGKYNLNRHNFQSVIDYRDILNTSQRDFYERALYMVKSHAPMRSEPRINTYA